MKQPSDLRDDEAVLQELTALRSGAQRPVSLEGVDTPRPRHTFGAVALTAAVVLAAFLVPAYLNSRHTSVPAATTRPTASASCVNVWERSDFVTGESGSPTPEAAVRSNKSLLSGEELRVLPPTQDNKRVEVEAFSASRGVRATFTVEEFPSGWVVTDARGCVLPDRRGTDGMPDGAPAE